MLDNDGAIITPVPYSPMTNRNTYLVNNNTYTSAMINNQPSENVKEDEDEESKSTTLGAVSKISFKKSFCPVFQKKSFESDSILGLTTESGSESLNCDSAIESEANNVADNIFHDNIENQADQENSETFLVSASSDKIVALKDFAFDKQENFFQVPEDLKIPLNIPKNQMLDIPLKETFTSRSSKTFEDLSLIEEITEHSSSISTIKSRDVTPRSFEQSLDPLQEEENKSILSQSEKTCHKPKILQKTYSFESPRSISSKINRVRSDFDVTLPSKSNPATPREDKLENEHKETVNVKKFAQNKPKIVAKRYQRSPPRESKSEIGIVPKPIQTKTGLILTQPVRDENEKVLGKRSASSASLILRSSPQPLNRQISKSTENIPRLIPQYRKEKYDHVESKVKKYIEDAKKMKTSSKAKEISRSCSNLLKKKKDFDVEIRPRTADATLKSREEHVTNTNPLRKSISKSETNLKKSKLSTTPSCFSKSSFSIGHIGAIYDTSEEEDLTQLTAIYNGDDGSTKAESLLDLVAKERKSKQEAKKVINELQTSYDDLLQKYAAAENALDKVRFGIKPKEDGSRQEAFTIAEKIAEKIAHYHLEETKDAKPRNKMKRCRTVADIQVVKDKIIGMSNQVRLS